MKSRIAATGASVLLVAAGLSAVSGLPAQADKRCSMAYLVINGNPGAEAPSGAFGHAHSTGNHYVRSQSGRVLTYWADNNGGRDGDTWDSNYGQITC